jgi:hypothetical protein
MNIFSRALFSGSVASLCSELLVLVRSEMEAGKAARGINDTSHWLWEERARRQKEFSWRYTATGYAIHHASSIFWAAFFEAILARKYLLRRFHELTDSKKPFDPSAPTPITKTKQKLELAAIATPSARHVVGAAAAVATLANIVDYKLTPKRLTPGFEKHLSRGSLALVYTAFGLGLVGAAQWRAHREKSLRNRIEANHRIDNQFDYAVVNYSSESH